MSPKPVPALRQFVEELALVYEQFGLPRMAGRIVGWLLVCDPGEQSLDELVAALQGSKASMSTMTRLLAQARIVERVSVPGDRRDRYRVRTDLTSGLTTERTKLTTAAREVLDRGLAAVGDRPPAIRARLQELRDEYAFFERELPKLFARWEREKRRARVSPAPKRRAS